MPGFDVLICQYCIPGQHHVQGYRVECSEMQLVCILVNMPFSPVLHDVTLQGILIVTLGMLQDTAKQYC